MNLLNKYLNEKIGKFNLIYLGINLSRPKVQSPSSSEVNQPTTRNGVARTSSNDDSGTSDDNCVSLNDKQQQLHFHQQQNVSKNEKLNKKRRELIENFNLCPFFH